MFAAATLPALMARMTVAGPVWQSPPQKSPSKPGTEPSGSVRIRPHAALDARALEVGRVDLLADGDVDPVAGHDALGLLGGAGRGSAAAGLPDDLRLHDDATDAAVVSGGDGAGAR